MNKLIRSQISDLLHDHAIIFRNLTNELGFEVKNTTWDMLSLVYSRIMRISPMRSIKISLVQALKLTFNNDIRYE